MADGIWEAERRIGIARQLRFEAGVEKLLDLSGLGLIELPDDLTRLHWLVSLDLSNNLLSTLPNSIGALKGLVELDVSGNRLTELPEGISALANLSSLDVSNNALQSLPDSFGALTKIVRLKLAGNPFRDPPPEITGEGTLAVMAFLRERLGNSQEQWLSKLLVVGEGASGKTSLINALAGRSHNPAEPQTHGVRIDTLEFTHPDPARARVRMQLNTWDFGGQQIYHATHQFFLTDRSLFLLAWNARVGWEQSKLEYWLDIIKARTPESPVILIATHCRDHFVDLPLSDLRRRNPRIVASCAVDSDDRGDGRIGVDELVSLIAAEAAALPLMGARWPSHWLAAAGAVRALPDTYVAPEFLWDTMRAAGVVEPKHQRDLAAAMHQLGDILYYQEDQELSYKVVLRPDWVNEYISKVLDSAAVTAQNGIVTAATLASLWPDLEPGLRSHFLGMMDKYDLSYRVDSDDDSEVSLVVEKLPWDPPADFRTRWDGLARERELRVRYKLNTLPPGIPTWFIARSHRFTTKTHWRTGAVFGHRDGNHLALVQTDLKERTVEIAVRGPMPAGFFSILDDGFRYTMRRYPGLSISGHVPCPCRGVPTETSCGQWFDMEILWARQRMKPPKKTIECPLTATDVSIDGLLSGGLGSTSDMWTATRQDAEFYQREFIKQQSTGIGTADIRCPRVFALVPAGRNLNFVQHAYELRLYCEQPGQWHRLGEKDGCYKVHSVAAWLRHSGPYFHRVLMLLKIAAPLVGPILDIAGEKLNEHRKSDIDKLAKVVDSTESLKYSGTVSENVMATAGEKATPGSFGQLEADFRVLESLLLKLDPDRVWGGLSKVVTPEGLVLYLCRDHTLEFANNRSAQQV